MRGWILMSSTTLNSYIIISLLLTVIAYYFYNWITVWIDKNYPYTTADRINQAKKRLEADGNCSKQEINDIAAIYTYLSNECNEPTAQVNKSLKALIKGTRSDGIYVFYYNDIVEPVPCFRVKINGYFSYLQQGAAPGWRTRDLFHDLAIIMKNNSDIEGGLNRTKGDKQ